MTASRGDDLPTIPNAGLLEEQIGVPLCLTDGAGGPHTGRYSCAFCGLGDSGMVQTEPLGPVGPPGVSREGIGVLKLEYAGHTAAHPARLLDGRRLEVQTGVPLASPHGAIVGTLELHGETRTVFAQRADTPRDADPEVQTFLISTPDVRGTKTVTRELSPTPGCAKLRASMGQHRSLFPIHAAPSILDARAGIRRSVSYDTAIDRLADLLLAHRPPHGRTLVYACGQVDYFAIFSFQEVFRLLGVRNLAGNAEHCLNAGAVHNEILTGQEGPFLTVDQALGGERRFFVMNGWNGFITHPPAFSRLLKRSDLDAYLVEVADTESAEALRRRLGADRVLFVRSGSDPHLALAVAHEVLTRYPGAVERRFIEQYSDRESFDQYVAMASAASFAPEVVAARIAPEAAYVDPLLRGIRDIAAKLARPDLVPINIPSVGLSQTKGAVSHCLWGSLLALVGKYGLNADGSAAGGTLRLPGQINAQTEVQGLSRRCFMGRIPMTEAGAAEAARRMGLPDDAYEQALRDTPRAALDYSDPSKTRELFVAFGTQFESNMMDRERWVRKLEDPRSTLVVIDPIPDPFSLQRADLIIPSPPHVAAPKLYQNGEWRLTLSVPLKRARPETRTDATITYDAMASISRRLREDGRLRAAHGDLARYLDSGYLRERFESPDTGGALQRMDGEVSRPQLWARILDYMGGGSGPLYCRPEHADGRRIDWGELLRTDSLVYGGVGTSRYRLAYDEPEHTPFRDIFRQPRKFTFFTPTEADLRIPDGPILNSGRSTLSDDRARIRFAISTFNSGKATTVEDLPDENPLYVSEPLARQLGLESGCRARVVNPETGGALVLPVVVTDRVKGDAAYVSFHKCRAELDEGRYLNTLTSHAGRCPYTSQSNFKSTRVTIERVDARHEDATAVEVQA